MHTPLISRVLPLQRTPQLLPQLPPQPQPTLTIHCATILPSSVLPLPARPIPRVAPTSLTSLARPPLGRGHHPQPVRPRCPQSCCPTSPPRTSESSRMPIPTTSKPSWRSSSHPTSASEAISPLKNCRPSTSPSPMRGVKATSRAVAAALLGTLVAGTRVLKQIGSSRGATI